MGDTSKQIESISQQPQPAALACTSATAKLQCRKPRGIFTATQPYQMQMLRMKHNAAAPWTGQNNYAGGDNAQQVNALGQLLRREVLQQQLEELAGPGPATPSTSRAGDGEEDAAAASPVVPDDGDNLVGNYQVNPLDGSLIKIAAMQQHPMDGAGGGVVASKDEERKLKLREATTNVVDYREAMTDFDSDGLQTDCNGRRKYRKRKFKDMYDDEDYVPSSVKNAPGIPKHTGDKAEEVLKAAKSLFSKRTRTLYHWLYPSTSKLELKNIVLSAWDTLPESEKHFYISQVLGRFGFPASNLMVNPQIGGLQSMPMEHLRGGVVSVAPTASTSMPGGTGGGVVAGTASGVGGAGGAMHEVTKRAVEELLANDTDSEWSLAARASRMSSERRYKRRKYNSARSTEPGSEPGSGSGSAAFAMDDDAVAHTPHDDEFQNDPELSKELAAFKMNTGMDLAEGNSEEVQNQKFGTI